MYYLLPIFVVLAIIALWLLLVGAIISFLNNGNERESYDHDKEDPPCQ